MTMCPRSNCRHPFHGDEACDWCACDTTDLYSTGLRREVEDRMAATDAT